MTDRYRFPLVRVEKVTDGDTFWLHVDVGFRTTVLAHCRLAEVDTPELFRPKSEAELDAARRARDVVADWLAEADGVVVATEPDPDSFGRWLARLTDAGGVSLADVLLDAELATRWPTRWREVYDAD